MRRREFITLLGGATFLTFTARAQQQPDQVRRIGVLMNLAANDPQGQARVAGFLQGLKQAGWTDDANARIDIR
ncbi:MAG TPA: ABC transporter substrate-binding protein, partial [Pseudolabrys sp.]|nr:ABC transporter substrate-binding protein [Pseudolabrys sp.]